MDPQVRELMNKLNDGLYNQGVTPAKVFFKEETQENDSQREKK